jgi:hypothetical protein
VSRVEPILVAGSVSFKETSPLLILTLLFYISSFISLPFKFSLNLNLVSILTSICNQIEYFCNLVSNNLNLYLFIDFGTDKPVILIGLSVIPTGLLIETGFCRLKFKFRPIFTEKLILVKSVGTDFRPYRYLKL